jgi:adenosylcobinamide-GDP ribazoletransferase
MKVPWVADFLEAVRFLTLFPIPDRKGQATLARAMFFFPLVGFLIGFLTLALIQGLSLYIFVRLHALALVTIPILLAGGIHVDGFADFCDGFFGGKTKEEILKIMRDSRIGVWGALGTSLLLFWKWELLASLPGQASEGALLLALTASRWAQVALAYFLPYANPAPGLGEAVAKKVKVRELAGATAVLALLVFFSKGIGFICLLALLPFLAGLGFLFYKRIGGITGDLLGAASEATELFVYLVLFLVKSQGYR